MSEVNSVQSTNPKANQHPKGNKKQHNNKGKGDKKDTNNVDGGKMEKRESKYLCNLCMEDHPTHLCPRFVEAQNLLAQNKSYDGDEPISTWEKYVSIFNTLECGRISQGSPASNSNNPTMNVYMMKVEAHIATRAQDYRMSKSIENGKENTNLLVPLQIEKMASETMTHIPKGSFNKYSHNLNERAAQNYSIVEYLA